MAEQQAAVERVLESKTSDEVMAKLTWKKEIARAKKLFEATAQDSSPSKDFIQLLVTEKGLLWRRWKISLRGVSRGAVPQPTEEALTYEDFLYSDSLQGDVERIFGEDVLRHIKRIVTGTNDNLSCLPKTLMIHVSTFLDLQSISQLSRANHHLSEVCNSNELWEKLYSIHQGTPSEEITALAKDSDWKTVFFMSKLQLQKELSRRRRLHSPQHLHSNGRQSPSSTFLTQAF